MKKLEFFLHKMVLFTILVVFEPWTKKSGGKKNWHLLEVAQALIFVRNVPEHFGVMLFALLLINWMPSKTLGFDTPLTILKSQFSHIPSLGSLSLKVFGYSAYALVPSKYRSILDPTTIKCLFLGYSPTRKGYKCFHPPSRKKFITNDVTFFLKKKGA